MTTDLVSDLERRGLIVREVWAACPACHAPVDMWCLSGCPAIDLGDYR